MNFIGDFYFNFVIVVFALGGLSLLYVLYELVRINVQCWRNRTSFGEFVDTVRWLGMMHLPDDAPSTAHRHLRRMLWGFAVFFICWIAFLCTAAISAFLGG